MSALEPVLDSIGVLAPAAVAASVVGSIASDFLRFWQGGPEARQQIKWLLYAGALVPLARIVTLLLENLYDATHLVSNVGNTFLSLAIAAIPVRHQGARKAG